MDLWPSFLISCKAALSCEMSSKTFCICRLPHPVTKVILPELRVNQESAECACKMLFKQALSYTPSIHLGIA